MGTPTYKTDFSGLLNKPCNIVQKSCRTKRTENEKNKYLFFVPPYKSTIISPFLIVVIFLKGIKIINIYKSATSLKSPGRIRSAAFPSMHVCSKRAFTFEGGEGGNLESRLSEKQCRHSKRVPAENRLVGPWPNALDNRLAAQGRMYAINVLCPNVIHCRMYTPSGQVLT